MLDEFFEVLARIYNVREWQRLPKAQRPTGDKSVGYARAFDAWLRDTFVPMMTQKIKDRKKQR